MRIEPNQRCRLATSSAQTCEGPHCDRVIAAENQRERFLADRGLDLRREHVTYATDDRKIARVSVFKSFESAIRYREIASIDDLSHAVSLQLFSQSRVTHRRRTHVYAAAIGAQVHRNADYIDAPNGVFSGAQ